MCDSSKTFDIVNNDFCKSDNLSVKHPERLESRLQKVDNASIFPNSTLIRMSAAQDDVLLTESQEYGKALDCLSGNQHDPSPFVAPESENSVLDSAKGSLVVQEAELWDSMVGKAAVVSLMSRSVIRYRQMEFSREISSATDSSRGVVFFFQFFRTDYLFM